MYNDIYTRVDKSKLWNKIFLLIALFSRKLPEYQSDIYTVEFHLYVIDYLNWFYHNVRFIDYVSEFLINQLKGTRLYELKFLSEYL